MSYRKRRSVPGSSRSVTFRDWKGVSKALKKNGLERLTINDIQSRNDLVLVTNPSDVEAVKQYLTKEELDKAVDLDGFFVKVGEGEYTEIYGFLGIVPNLWKDLFRIR